MQRFSIVWCCGIVCLTCIGLRGQETATPPKQTAVDTPVSSETSQPIDFERARQLLRKVRNGEKLTAEERNFLERAQAARRTSQPGNRQPQNSVSRAVSGKEQIGQKPLTEMTAEDRYLGQDGGLYGAGRNNPPEAHRQAAEAELARIQPLDINGKPAADGWIAFISISMSNATQEFSTFKPIADASPVKASRVTVIDCAQGGQAMAEWAPPDARPWQETDHRLLTAGITPSQVQVAWIKLANKGPRGSLDEHARQLQKDTRAVIQNAKARFPNLRIAYLSSRIYGGYTTGGLNPEPYAFESAFAARWLIQDQIAGDENLNFDPGNGTVNAPLLLWGPYLWADGTQPRVADKLVYLREDLAGDGTHPSPSGRRKVAEQLLQFFSTDPLAKPWFAKPVATTAP